MNKELELEAEKYCLNSDNIPARSQHINIEHCEIAYIAGATSKFVEKQKEKLIKERDMYRQAYEELSCYFDSISEEEQLKVARRLKKIFKNLDL